MKLTKLVEQNVRRTPYQAMAASMVMFLTFLTLQLFLILAVGSQKILQFYEGKPQAIAFFKDNTTDEDVRAIKNALNQSGMVASLKYVSKDDALRIYQDRNKNNPSLLELVTANILPSSLEISTNSPKDLAPVAEILKKEPVVEEVIYPEDVVAALTQATTIIRIIGISAVSFLIVFAFLVILMVIGFKIRLKRTEIETMKLLGASTWFIRAPFLLEGMFYGITGAFCAWVLSYAMLWYFTPFLQNALGEINILPVSWVLMLLLLIVAIFTAGIIGVLGSFGAVRRYLK